MSDTLPPLFTTAGEESFARRSIRDRHAATLLEVIELNGVGEPYRTRLLDFRRESLGGRLTDPLAGNRAGWDPALFERRELADWRRAIRPQVGRSWYELPWYFAESFWFLKLLFLSDAADPPVGAAGLVLIKGDANYRRLVGDRHWPPSTPLESLTGYFPAPLAVLRTMKSEIVVDLSEAQVEGLQKEDPEWRTNGRRGLVRLVPRDPAALVSPAPPVFRGYCDRYGYVFFVARRR